MLLMGGVSADEAGYLEGYTSTEYVLRWWYPESTYREFAIAPELPVGRSAWRIEADPHGPVAIAESIGESLGNQLHIDDQLRLYRMLIYRDLDGVMGQTRFRLYVRNDLLPIYDEIRY